MTSQSAAIAGIDSVPDVDAKAITVTLHRLLAGFADRDADVLDGVYTHDADWVNAFGSVKRGNSEIVSYLRGLFHDQNFTDGTLVDGPHNRLRRLDERTVVISTHLQVTGQGLLEGGTISLRNNYSLHILQKQPDGTWLIASEMFNDANTDHSYINHS